MILHDFNASSVISGISCQRATHRRPFPWGVGTLALYSLRINCLVLVKWILQDPKRGQASKWSLLSDIVSYFHMNRRRWRIFKRDTVKFKHKCRTRDIAWKGTMAFSLYEIICVICCIGCLILRWFWGRHSFRSNRLLSGTLRIFGRFERSLGWRWK